jgi:hypothetical protein
VSMEYGAHGGVIVGVWRAAGQLSAVGHE